MGLGGGWARVGRGWARVGRKIRYHHHPKVELGQKPGFGKVGGHKLAKVLVIRAENGSSHTNSVPLSQIWPPKKLGDGQKIRSNQNLGFWKMGCNRQAGPWACWGSIIWGPFGYHLRSLFVSQLFGAHLWVQTGYFPNCDPYPDHGITKYPIFRYIP